MIVDIYISHIMHKEAIEYARVLIKKYKNYLGYERACKSLVHLKFESAKKIIEEGIKMIPNQLQLLIIGIKINQALNENVGALKLSKRIIETIQMRDWILSSSSTLVSTGRFKEKNYNRWGQ